MYKSDPFQIIHPHDTGIAQAILDNLEPRIQDRPDVYASSLCYDPTDEMKENYFTLIRDMASPRFVVECYCYVRIVIARTGFTLMLLLSNL